MSLMMIYSSDRILRKFLEVLAGSTLEVIVVRAVHDDLAGIVCGAERTPLGRSDSCLTVSTGPTPLLRSLAVGD